MKQPDDLKSKLIKVQGGRLYLPVAARIGWFRENYPLFGIETEITEHVMGQYALCCAYIKDDTGRTLAMGRKMETLKGFPDYLEKAEKGAIGRALGVLGFGTDDIEDDNDYEANVRPCDAPSQRPTQRQETAFSQEVRTNANLPAQNGHSPARCECGRVLTPKQASGEIPCPSCGKKGAVAA